MDCIQSYFKIVNKIGGVNGLQIVLKSLDDENKSAKVAANERQLVEKDQVFALFASIKGGPSTAVMKVADELNVPFFGPMAGFATARAVLTDGVSGVCGTPRQISGPDCPCQNGRHHDSCFFAGRYRYRVYSTWAKSRQFARNMAWSW